MSPSSPLLAATMIVRDEEDALPACLASLTGVVDEIVIYGTDPSTAPGSWRARPGHASSGTPTSGS